VLADRFRLPDGDGIELMSTIIESIEQRQLRLGVAYPRDVVEDELLVGEQAGSEDRQGSVLVACRGDLARERAAALNDEVLHRSEAGLG
jgi:hypothetical protein